MQFILISWLQQNPLLLAPCYLLFGFLRGTVTVLVFIDLHPEASVHWSVTV